MTLAADASTERELCAVLAGVVRSGADISVDSDFFDDLGADSMLMARFCARVRRHAGLPAVSMREIYRHRTVRRLAAALEPAPLEPAASRPVVSVDQPFEPRPASAREHVACGALQVLALLAYTYLVTLAVAAGFSWVVAGSSAVEVYWRCVVAGSSVYVGLSVLPIVAKWSLVGRWRPQEIRIWSLVYVRFWVVRSLVRSSPLARYAGSPLYVLYLRALGAKIGPRVLILSRHVPVCTDLLTVGADAVIRKDCFFTGYRAEAGVIRTGPVRIGSGAVVGEATVLDIDTTLGANAQVGHASSLYAGQVVPDGERRHGSPALVPTVVDYRDVDAVDCSRLRRVLYPAVQVTALLLVGLPLVVAATLALVEWFPHLAALVAAGPAALAEWDFYRNAMVSSLVLFFGGLVGWLAFVLTFPRLLHLTVAPDRAYPLYGVHYWAHRVIARTTNVPFFTHLFGDSSYVVPYLRALGYDLSHIVQTGSNFGLEMKHETPYLTTVGSGTMVADGLSVINADFSSTSFRVSRATIGPDNFLGNHIVYPSRSRTGENCLLATKVMVPVDGDVRRHVGLLGSPSFEIPRSVQRDARFDALLAGDGLRRRLAAKNRHNAVTIGQFLLAQWLHALGLTMLAAAALALHDPLGAVAFAMAGGLAVAWGVAFFGLVERAAFQRLRPRFCSIYEPYFWWHERYWKLSTQPRVLDGTPFKALAWRLLGVRIGKRVFDDGSRITEKTLVTLGDDCALNAGSLIQPHSQEDGTFKSDRVTIGHRCTVGVAALVHYGVTIGDGAMLAPDTFLMKGEEVPARAHWGMNPARDLRSELAAPVGRSVTATTEATSD
jgi:non-ribosomal peptide synthetase-like protein